MIKTNNIGDYINSKEENSVNAYLDRHFGNPKDLPNGTSRIKRIRMITSGLAVIATLGAEFLEREGGGSTIRKIHQKNSPK